jgi:4-amino-4-deoxy-L-arabinose transferase-like glycosyltransferase
MSKRTRARARAAAAPPPDTRPFHERSPLLFLAIATAIALLPFVNKAFTMDDPLFVWSAQWIADHPFDPYGFTLNWYGRTQPMHDVMQNPPLTSYALAAASAITGWNEPTLHIVFGLFAFAAVAGTWSLARGMTERPLLAALLTLAMPFFLVSATNVMSDVPMLACFVWALALWRRGLDENRDLLLWLAALLAAAAGLFKYFGAAAVPLMLVYALMQRRWSKLVPLALPVAVFVAYDLATHAITGAAQYANVERTHTFAKTSVMLSFAGGGMIALLFFAFLMKRLVVPIIVAAAAIAIVVITGAPASPVQFTIFVAVGLGVFVLAVWDVWRPSADSVLLLLWILGTAVFSAYLNWTVNARSLLPLAPAVAILIARHVEASRNAIIAATAATAAVALVAGFADQSYANAQRDAAKQLMDHYAGDGHRMWFEGHWGFQYYMQQAGAVPFGFDVTLHGKDLLVTPSTNTLLLNEGQRPPHHIIETLQIPIGVPAATVSYPMKAAFYSDYMGPLPYVLGAPPAETYTVRRLGR